MNNELDSVLTLWALNLVTHQETPMDQLTQSPLGRRRAHRVDLSLGAAVSAGERSLPGRIVNLSVGGALFKSKQRRARFPGPCHLTVSVGDTPKHQVSIPVNIVRAVNGQFGLEWRYDHMNPETRALLRVMHG